MFIDVHTHLTDKIYCGETDKLVENFLLCGVDYVIDSGFDFDSSKQVFANSIKYENVYSAIGIHPENCRQLNKEFLDFVSQSANSKKVVAIGEIGLDYHYEGFDKIKQKECFERQIVLADELKLPFVVHSRDASKDVCDILKANKKYINQGFLMHCYSESIEQAKNYIDLGAFFSFGGVITFKNSHREEVVKKIPIDRILSETDAPYLSPEPLRGKVNRSENVSLIAKKLAEIFSISLESMCEIIKNNSSRLFQNIKQK